MDWEQCSDKSHPKSIKNFRSKNMSSFIYLFIERNFKHSNHLWLQQNFFIWSFFSSLTTTIASTFIYIIWTFTVCYKDEKNVHRKSSSLEWKDDPVVCRRKWKISETESMIELNTWCYSIYASHSFVGHAFNGEHPMRWECLLHFKWFTKWLGLESG